MPRLTIAIGLPGAGKSTWFEQRGIRAVSLEPIRELLTEDPHDQSAQVDSIRILQAVISSRLQRGLDTAIDATNTSARSRSRLIQIARRHGATIEAVYFATPLDTCIRRNDKRTIGRVPADRMLDMAGKINPPSITEGFSSIIRPV